jgi:branched-chain amino acid transport system substrate-binding protein
MDRRMQVLSVVWAVLVGFAAVAWSGGVEAGEPIKFGVSTALSGDAAAYGKPFLDAINVMADLFNEQGGISGRRIEVISYDDRGTPDQALQAAKKLVQSDRVHTLQPGSTSGCIFAAMPVGKEGKVAMWGYGLAEKWLVEGEGMIFRSAPPDQVMIPALAKFAYDSKKLRNVGILHIDTFYGETAKEIFTDEFKKLGGAVPSVTTYADGTRDFSSQLLTLARAKIDGLFMVVQGGAVAPALRQIKTFLPPAVTLLSSNEFYAQANRNEAGDMANGVYYFMHPMIHQNPDPVVQKWLAEMKKRLGITHEIFARAIAGMTVMKEAITLAGTTEAVAVMKQVHRLKNIPTPLGPFTYDPRDGEGLKSAVVLLAKGGADMSKDEVVFRSTSDRELYKQRVNYKRFFGDGYEKELYAFHGVK